MTVRTGATEPAWPTKKGAKIIEYSELDAATLVAPPVDDPTPDLPPDIDDRYANRYWRRSGYGRIAG